MRVFRPPILMSLSSSHRKFSLWFHNTFLIISESITTRITSSLWREHKAEMPEWTKNYRQNEMLKIALGCKEIINMTPLWGKYKKSTKINLIYTIIRKIQKDYYIIYFFLLNTFNIEHFLFFKQTSSLKQCPAYYCSNDTKLQSHTLNFSSCTSLIFPDMEAPQTFWFAWHLSFR